MSFRMYAVEPLDQEDPNRSPAQQGGPKKNLAAMGWKELLDSVVEAQAHPAQNFQEHRRQVALREQARRKHSSVSLQIRNLKKRFDLGQGTRDDKARLDELRGIQSVYEAHKQSWKPALIFNPGKSIIEIDPPDRDRTRLQQSWQDTFDRSTVANAMHTNVSYVRTRAGGQWPTHDAVIRYQKAFGTNIGGDPNVGDDASYHANGFQIGGDPNGFGRIDKGRFNKGQSDADVKRSEERKRQERAFYFTPDGKKRTPSSRIRESINQMRSDMSGQLSGYGMPSWASDMVTDSLLTPFNIGAEIQTVGDWQEDAQVRGGAGFNAVVGLLTTSAGGKLVAPVLAPVLRPVSDAARRLGKRAAPILKEFGQTLWKDAAKAVDIAHRRLGIPRAQAQRMVEDVVAQAKSLSSKHAPLRPRNAVKPDADALAGGRVYSSQHQGSGAIGKVAKPSLKNALYGQQEVIKAIDWEKLHGTAFANTGVYNIARDWVKKMPPEQWKLIMEFSDDVLDKEGKRLYGDYRPFTTGYGGDPYSRVMRISRDFAPAQHVLKTLVHEHAHHLQQFLSDDDMKVLMRQYKIEKRNDLFHQRKKKAGKFETRYSTFSEWWADSVMDHVDRTQFRKQLADKGVEGALSRSSAAVQRTLIAIRRIFLRNGKRDHMARIFEQIAAGNRSFDAGADGAQQLYQDLLKDFPNNTAKDFVDK